jgi:PEGA domain
MASRSGRLSILVLLAAVSGCATVMASGPDRVSVATNPSGATVFVDDLPAGQTPLLVTLDRTHSRGVIRLELPGFQPITIMRDKLLNTWFFGNLCLGGLLGMIIDFATGDVMKFDDTPIMIGLTPAGVPGAAPGATSAAPAGTPVVRQPLPAPVRRLTPCQEERHRVLVEAAKIQDKYERIKMVQSAPTC